MFYSRARLLILGLAVLLVPVLWADEANPASSAADKFHLLSRHLRFLAVDGHNQFRYMDSKPHQVTARDDYYKLSTVARLSFVGEDTTYVQMRGESGRNFASSCDYAGLGMHPGYWSFNIKSLFVGQRIGRHLQAQAGGIEFDRGAGTEATYADNDAWLEGYRLAYVGSEHRWTPDFIGATVGYVGDFSQPNAFARLPHMGDENYVQMLARKHFGVNRDVSAEFDSLQGIDYTREAIHLQKLHLMVVDELVAEGIGRTSDDGSLGWSGSLFRTLDAKGRVRLGAFISDMPAGIFLKDKETIMMNGDFYVLGQRLGPNLRIVPLKNFELNLQGSARTDNTPGTRYRGQATVTYHFADLLNRVLR